MLYYAAGVYELSRVHGFCTSTFPLKCGFIIVQVCINCLFLEMDICVHARKHVQQEDTGGK